MTEEQNEKLHELYEKQYVKYIPLTYDEKIQLMELQRIKRHERDEKQERLRVTACAKLASVVGLTYDELEAFCDWIRR